VNSNVAFIRGINVGGRNSLTMKQLTEVLEDIGSSNIETYIQSGNVLFDSDLPVNRLSGEIASEIARRRGFRPEVLVLEKYEFEQAIDNNPFPGESDPQALHLGFLKSVPSNPDLKTLEDLRGSNERFELIGRVFYLLAPDGIGRSKLAAKREKALGVPMTDRNWKTVGRIMAILKARS